jgi:hypothetical protein
VSGSAVQHLPDQPAADLGHNRSGALDGGRQLIQRPPQPVPHPPLRAECSAKRLLRSTPRPRPLSQISERPIACAIVRLIYSLPSLAWVPNLLATWRTRRAAAPQPATRLGPGSTSTTTTCP